MAKVLIACESSGTVRDAFRKHGHDAYSCDLLDADTDPTYHIKGDAIPVIERGWDLVIAHPPCTHLAVSGARHFAKKKADGRQQQGIDLFMAFVNQCNKYASHWVIENPIGIMSTLYRKPDQIIHPYHFGHEASKATCLWLNNLPLLTATNVVGKGEQYVCKSGKKYPMWSHGPSVMSNNTRWKLRSKTFQGIADAMANQWGPLI